MFHQAGHKHTYRQIAGLARVAIFPQNSFANACGKWQYMRIVCSGAPYVVWVAVPTSILDGNRLSRQMGKRLDTPDVVTVYARCTYKIFCTSVANLVPIPTTPLPDAFVQVVSASERSEEGKVGFDGGRAHRVLHAGRAVSDRFRPDGGDVRDGGGHHR